MNVWLILMIAAIVVFVVIPDFKDRIIPVKKLIISPAIFMYLLYNNATTNFYLNFETSLLLILGLMTGTAIGILIHYKTQVKSDQDQKLIGCRVLIPL